MSIHFFPLGIPISGSYAVSASFAVTTSLGGLPVSASIAEFVVNPTGPQGPAYKTVNASQIV